MDKFGKKIYIGNYKGKEVAIKRIRLNLVEEEELVNHREIKIMNLTNHDHILKLYSYDKDEKYIHLFLEKCECSLFEIWKNDSMMRRILDSYSWKQFVYKVAGDCLKGLKYLHS